MASLILYMVLIPIIGALGIAFSGAQSARRWAVGTGAVTAVLSVFGLIATERIQSGFHHFVSLPWLPRLGLQFLFGLDGMSSLLVLLTAWLAFASILAAPVKTGAHKLHYGSILAATGLTIAAFSALDLLLFYIAFEACLIPVLFTIGVLGGADRSKAAVSFFVFTVLGSLMLLSAIIGIRLEVGTFDYLRILEVAAGTGLTDKLSTWIVVASVLAFGIKAAMFPLHAWLSRTYANTPIGMLVILSGVMAKLGTYGFVRFMFPLAGDAVNPFIPLLMTLAVVGILYGGIVAAGQKDVKLVVAFSSISHIGYILLGIFSGNTIATSGAVLQMVNHGLTTAALLLCIGWIEVHRGSRNVDSLGGIWDDSPFFSRVLLIFTFSAVALPLTNGFVGEFLILLGSFYDYPIHVAVASAGAIASAVYMLIMVQRAIYGKVKGQDASPVMLGSSEKSVMIALVILVFSIGIVPGTLLNIAVDHGHVASKPSVRVLGEVSK